MYFYKVFYDKKKRKEKCLYDPVFRDSISCNYEDLLVKDVIAEEQHRNVREVVRSNGERSRERENPKSLSTSFPLA